MERSRPCHHQDLHDLPENDGLSIMGQESTSSKHLSQTVASTTTRPTICEQDSSDPRPHRGSTRHLYQSSQQDQVLNDYLTPTQRQHQRMPSIASFDGCSDGCSDDSGATEDMEVLPFTWRRTACCGPPLNPLSRRQGGIKRQGQQLRRAEFFRAPNAPELCGGVTILACGSPDIKALRMSTVPLYEDSSVFDIDGSNHLKFDFTSIHPEEDNERSLRDAPRTTDNHEKSIPLDPAKNESGDCEIKMLPCCTARTPPTGSTTSASAIATGGANVIAAVSSSSSSLSSSRSPSASAVSSASTLSTPPSQPQRRRQCHSYSHGRGHRHRNDMCPTDQLIHSMQQQSLNDVTDAIAIPIPRQQYRARKSKYTKYSPIKPPDKENQHDRSHIRKAASPNAKTKHRVALHSIINTSSNHNVSRSKRLLSLDAHKPPTLHRRASYDSLPSPAEIQAHDFELAEPHPLQLFPGESQHGGKMDDQDCPPPRRIFR